MIELIRGDCLIESDKIKSGSVDLILTDLPYGNMKGINNPLRPKSWGNKDYFKWDLCLEPKKIHKISNRILRKNGKMILFANQPFTTNLISNQITNLTHCYNMYWNKTNFANCLFANKAPVSYVEDILVFSKNYDTEGLHPLREYFLSEKKIAKLTDKNIKKILGNEMGGHYFTKGIQFCIPTLSNYEKLQSTGYFKRDWSKLKVIDTEYKEQYPSTFNLWQGKKYKSNILKYKKDYNGYHPTQKPVLLLEDLIKTFSNKDDLVVDLTMGSGSTGVACINTNRNFTGIELDDKYFEIAQKRIKNTQRNLF